MCAIGKLSLRRIRSIYKVCDDDGPIGGVESKSEVVGRFLLMWTAEAYRICEQKASEKLN